ncbi:MAG: O-antigen ligase family protein [Pseudomonadota bacterium]|nr:O-antigen ligase family protein [Pseudomonadota bacterium]
MEISNPLSDRSLVNRSQLPPLDAIVYSSMGLLVLLLGSWVPDARLNISGLPLDLILMAASALLATTGTIRISTFKSIAILQIPLVLTGITLFWSLTPEIGLDKLTTLLISGNLGFILFNTVIEKHGVDQLGKLIIFYLSLLLIVAIPYKLVNGFFDRSVNFFINGPIIFARLMAIAAVLSIFFLRNRARIFSVIIFFLAVVWTESKGPILALTLTLISVAILATNSRTRKRFCLGFVLITLSVIWGFYYFDLGARDLGRVGIFYSVATGDLSAIEAYSSGGSLGGRIEMWSKTINLIPERPFGIGLGAWDRAIDTRLPTPYAHNIFLELWSETGVILGSFASIPFLVFLFSPKKMFWFVAFCLFLAQMISGDIGDARFLMVFGFLAYFAKPENSNLGNFSDLNKPIRSKQLEFS